LFDRLKDLARRYFNCTAYHVHKVAFIFAENRNLKYPCGNNILNRKRGLYLRTPDGLTKAREESVDRNTVHGFIDQIKEIRMRN
jgi:hypothetical protein